jgi:hypothetical protein
VRHTCKYFYVTFKHFARCVFVLTTFRSSQIQRSVSGNLDIGCNAIISSGGKYPGISSQPGHSGNDTFKFCANTHEGARSLMHSFEKFHRKETPNPGIRIFTKVIKEQQTRCTPRYEYHGLYTIESCESFDQDVAEKTVQPQLDEEEAEKSVHPQFDQDKEEKAVQPQLYQEEAESKLPQLDQDEEEKAVQPQVDQEEAASTQLDQDKEEKALQPQVYQFVLVKLVQNVCDAKSESTTSSQEESKQSGFKKRKCPVHSSSVKARKVNRVTGPVLQSVGLLSASTSAKIGCLRTEEDAIKEGNLTRE